MGNPFFNNAKNQTWQMMRRRQMPLEPGKDAHSVVTEDWRREEDEKIVQTIPAPVRANKPAAAPTIPITPSLSPHRDFHKVGSFYVMVANIHLPGQDDDLDPGFSHTIMGGYAKAIDLQAQLIVAFPGVPLNFLRVSVIVAGGYYKENCIFDTSFIDVVGLGYPIITADINPDVDWSAVVTIKTACQQIIFDGFEIFNQPPSEGVSTWGQGLGLIVEEGNQGVDGFESAIQLKNLVFEGGGTQMYIQRRVTGWNVRTYSVDNYTNPWAPEASVVIRFCFGGGPINPQSMWSQFYGCHFAGQSTGTGETIKRGKALSIYAFESDLATWIPNSTTMGGVAPESDSFLCQSGAYFHNCRIEGWTENKGWAAEFHSCKNIQGQWINDTGSGGVHHIMQSNTDVGCEAYTWFTGGTEVDCNYLCFFSDTNVAAPTARCIVWLRNMIHACPTLPQPPGGGTAMGATSFGAKGALYGLQAATSLGWFFGPGAGPAFLDLGILTNCSSGKTNSLSNTAGIPNEMMRQGYQNFKA